MVQWLLLPDDTLGWGMHLGNIVDRLRCPQRQTYRLGCRAQMHSHLRI